ncbi:MAG: hypothetical protein Pg6C_19420 [Treponemataceae bacterium]|nr:MAG: hypothetical protein Pg6C_19420 [Treponemataceae bacterium]
MKKRTIVMKIALIILLLAAVCSILSAYDPDDPDKGRGRGNSGSGSSGGGYSGGGGSSGGYGGGGSSGGSSSGGYSGGGSSGGGGSSSGSGGSSGGSESSDGGSSGEDKGSDRGRDSNSDSGTSDAAREVAEASAALSEAKRAEDKSGMAKAQQALENAKYELLKACENRSGKTGENPQDLYQSIMELVAEYGDNVAEHIPEAAGDPVILSTGQFALIETDITVPSGLRIISAARQYVSGKAGEKTVYKGDSFGPLWKTGIDMRIVRGTSLHLEEALMIQQLIVNEQQIYLAETEAYASANPDCIPILNEMRSIIAASIAKLTYLKNEVEKARRLQALNVYVLDGIDSELVMCGNNTLFFISSDGSPLLYEYAGKGTWQAPAASGHACEIIQTLDGNDAESTAGFTRLCKNGVREYFDQWGRPQKTTDRAGNQTLFSHNEKTLEKITTAEGIEINFSYENNRVSAIQSSTGERIAYAYAHGMLSAVTDDEGDVVRYEYDSDGYLAKIIKPDSSFITIEYGLVNSTGNKMVSATANEEGFKETFSYALSDKQTTHTDHTGVKTRYTYDGHGNTIRIEAAGKTVNLKYNERGLLTEKKDHASTITYSYDERNNLLSKSYSDGSAETWQYNTLDQVTRYVDRDGIVRTFVYDQYGNNTAAYLSDAQIWSASFTGAGRIASVTDADGIVHSYSYDARGNIAVYTASQKGDSLTEYRECDSRNRLIKTTTAQNQITYEYSPHKMIIRNSIGLETIYTYNQRKDIVLVEERDTMTGEKRCYSYVYDKRHLPVMCTVTSASGEVVFEARYEYDAAGKKTSDIFGEWRINYAYDSSGRIASRSSTKTGSAKTFTETFTYAWTTQGETRTVSKPLGISTTYAFDPWGRLYSVTDPNGNAVRRQLSNQGRALKEQTAFGGYNEFKYDSLGRLAAFGEENSVPARAAYNGAGKILSQTDREGNVTQYEFNVMGIKKETAPDYTCLYFYDNAGRLIKRILGESEKRYEYIIEYAYSENGRTVTVTEGGVYRSVLRVNPWGDIVSVTNGEGHTRLASYDALGRLCVSADGYGNKTLIAYNALGFVKRIDYPDGGKEEYDYDYAGNLISVVDSMGVKWQGKYDEPRRLIEERGRPGIHKTYSYDNAGNVIQIQNGGEITASYNFADRGRAFSFVDGNGNRYNYSFNEFGRLTGEQNRVKKTQSYEYTPEGRLSKTVDFAGNSVITGIEKANRTRTVTAVSREGNSRVAALLKTDMSGNIVEAKSGTGSIFYTYDTGGRLIKQFDSGANETTAYRYDKAGRRVFMQSGDREVSYIYGKNDELLFISDNKQRLSVSFEYDVMGREVKRSNGNGVAQTAAYDKAGRVIAVSETNPAGFLIRFEGYLYDGEGRRSRVIDKNGSVTFYEYDSQSRLSSVMYPFSAERRGAALSEAAEAGLYFSENAGGGENKALSAEENSRFAALLRAVRAEQVRAPSVTQHCIKEAYAYDANGNRSAKITGFGVIRYAYDAEDRLVSAGDSGNGIRYVYDDAGNMIQKKSLYTTLDMRYNELDRLEYSKMTAKGALNKADSASLRSSFGADTQYEIRYQYDALGRRVITQDITRPALRTLYDGLTFDIIKEQEIFASGAFTGSLMPDSASPANNAESGRYRFIDDSGASDSRARQIENGNSSVVNFNDSHAMLYARGKPVALSRNSAGVNASRSYFGTDALGSVKSATGENGEAKSLYDYDAFGSPTLGDFSASARLGYTGKQRDAVTGFYNYGYRDYSPADGRFTTSDPVRDGWNWFAYTHNDPVNFVDMWGLLIGKIDSQFDYVQQDSSWKDFKLGSSDITVEKEGCKVTAVAQVISTILDTKIDPGKIATSADENGNLSQQSVVARMAKEGIAVKADYFEKTLTAETLNAIKNSADTTYIIAKVAVGGGLGTHFVVVEDFYVDEKSGIITYSTNGTSLNDGAYGNNSSPRTYSSTYAFNDSKRYGVVVKIETYTVNSVANAENKKNK